MARKSQQKSTRTPRQARSVETVAAILDAAAQILVRDGAPACTTNEIAKRAGVSIGTLYQYFADKEAVLGELFARELAKDSTAIQAMLTELDDRPIEEVVPRIIEVTLDRLATQPRLRQIVINEFAAKRDYQQDIKRHVAKAITSYLREHPQFRIPREIRLEMLIVVNAIEAALYAAIWQYGARLDRRRLVAEVSDLVLRYLSKYRSA